MDHLVSRPRFSSGIRTRYASWGFSPAFRMAAVNFDKTKPIMAKSLSVTVIILSVGSWTDENSPERRLEKTFLPTKMRCMQRNLPPTPPLLASERLCGRRASAVPALHLATVLELLTHNDKAERWVAPSPRWHCKASALDLDYCGLWCPMEWDNECLVFKLLTGFPVSWNTECPVWVREIDLP